MSDCRPGVLSTPRQLGDFLDREVTIAVAEVPTGFLSQKRPMDGHDGYEPHSHYTPNAGYESGSSG